MQYVDIILPQAGPSFFTYHIDDKKVGGLQRGSAVAVPFGVRQIVGGIVREVHDRKPHFKTKAVIKQLFARPIVSEAQLKLWEWVAEYYMCGLGEVMLAALPALLKPKGFSDDEFEADEFRPRRVRVVGLIDSLRNQEAFSDACEELQRAKKQYNALVEIGNAVFSTTPSREWIPRTELQAGPMTLASLQKKGLIVISEREPTPEESSLVPDSSLFTPHSPLPLLSPAQQTCLDQLREAFKTHTTALLFGVPSSGKSEVCFHAIAATLSRGRDVLLLLPEIALSTQFVRRVKRVFGDNTVLYHSALSPRKRAEAYIRLARSQGGSLVVGTRSALFLPLPRLGLVVVDEEQDASYKQADPAPRYNARDAAVVLAGSTRAKVILASATPSLETWANASAGKYGLVTLSERWGGTLPPETIISDTLRAAKRGERRAHLNKDLSDSIADALGRNEQIILFQNRRGIAPFVECSDCGHVPRCEHCAIPMTAHRTTLRCHYCGAVQTMPALCPSCGSMNLSTRGFGTEKIEEELSRLFPQARVARLDRDSATSESAYNRIIDDFEAGATDILVGTQMVTKGLDFAGVSLVGVLNADNLVNHPDFRASERAWSLMAQVAGRAGRHSLPRGGKSPGAGSRGKVVIQTAAPESRLIAQAAAGDYHGMAADILNERAAYGYPPYTRLISVMMRHADRDALTAAAKQFGEVLRGGFSSAAANANATSAAAITTPGPVLLGPQPPVTEKIKGQWALVYLLKIPRQLPLAGVRGALQSAIASLTSDPVLRKTAVTVNVDPV